MVGTVYVHGSELPNQARFLDDRDIKARFQKPQSSGHSGNPGTNDRDRKAIVRPTRPFDM
jgi:hypothetical protein